MLSRGKGYPLIVVALFSKGNKNSFYYEKKGLALTKKTGLYTLGLSVIAKEHSDCGNLLACCSVGDSHARFSRSE